MLLPAIVLSTALAVLTTVAQGGEPWHDEYARLLRTYSKPAGVDYSAWHTSAPDREALRGIVEAIAAKGPQADTREARIAYLANAYNAWVLYLVLEKWPVGSVTDLAPNFGFFSSESIRVAGRPISLNTLEKESLLKEFREPRIHFIVNCASRSCPPLPPLPLSGATLEKQMDDAARAFLADETVGVVVPSHDELRVSRIFEWYRNDFEASGGILEFIRRYRDLPLDDDREIEFLEYDWAINAL